MTLLCVAVGDSLVKRFDAFLDSQASADVFKIVDFPQVNVFGIRGGAVTNLRHLRTILSVIEELTAFSTECRVQFKIPRITVMRFMARVRTTV